MKTGWLKNSAVVAGFVFFVLVIIAIFIAGPLLTIGALNTMFSLGIPYNFWTWLSTFWLQLLFVVPKSYKKN